MSGGNDSTKVLKKCLKLLAYLNSRSDLKILIVMTNVKSGPPCSGNLEVLKVTKDANETIKTIKSKMF